MGPSPEDVDRMQILETRPVTRRLASPHALASQVLYAARLAGSSPEGYEAEVDNRLHRLPGLTDWELAQVRSEVAFRLASANRHRQASAS